MPTNPMIPLLATLVASALAAGPDHRSTAPVPREDAGILERQAEVLRRARESPPTPVVFIGDSITQSWEGPGAETWKASFAPRGAVNLGVSGDRTEHVLWRLAHAPITRLEPKVVVLLIGTNNLGHATANAEQTFDGIAKVVETVLAQAPGATVALCAILPRDGRFTPIRRDCLAVNQTLAAGGGGGRRGAIPRSRRLDSRHADARRPPSLARGLRDLGRRPRAGAADGRPRGLKNAIAAGDSGGDRTLLPFVPGAIQAQARRRRAVRPARPSSATAPGAGTSEPFTST
jgi:lysophospholipase L1-like esterase